jgi:hypothetical protein
MKHVQLLILVSSKKKFVFLERQEKDKIKNSVDILSQIKYKLSATATKQCCGSGMFIPDPNCLHPGSASKNLSILTIKKT